MTSLPETLALVRKQLIQYICPAYLLFGITGSCLNIILLTQRQCRMVSCCIYFIVISLLPLITIPMTFAPFLDSLGHPDLTLINIAFCKIRGYVLQSSTMSFRWCLVGACFDRYVITLENGRLKQFARVRVAYRVVAVIIISWLIIPVHVLIFFYPDGTKCYVLDNIAAALYHSMYTLITGNILPVIIMTVCAVLTRRNLVRKSERRRQLVVYVHTNNMVSERRHIQQVFPMLLLQVLIYVITQTPWMLFNIYNTVTIYVTNKSADRIAVEQFLSFLVQTITCLITVLPFYLYTLVSREYRDQLMKLWRLLYKCKKPNGANRINPLAVGAPTQIVAPVNH